MEKSLTCVKENIFTKISSFIKNIFKKPEINYNLEEYITSEVEIDNSTKRSKEELLEIYNKAKKNEYDLDELELDEIMMFINFIKEEISIKKERLEEIRGM